jgi:hypothetical protein
MDGQRNVEVLCPREQRVVQRMPVRQARRRERGDETAAAAVAYRALQLVRPAWGSVSERCAIGMRRPPLLRQNPATQRLYARQYA